MNMKPLAAVTAASALVLAALACAAPDIGAADATGVAAQMTVIAGLTQVNIQFTPDDSESTLSAAFIETVNAAKAQATATMQQATVNAAVVGTLGAGTPQPPPATITLAPTEPAAQPTAVPPTAVPATAVPPPAAPATGSVSGKLCYPASVLPALTIYAKDVATSAIFQQENAENQSSYTLANLPVGTYYLFAWTHPGTSNPTAIGIGYTQFVLCGMQQSCSDHSMLAVPVVANATTPNIDICDGYDASAIPPKP
jgi:hypothetical protein